MLGQKKHGILRKEKKKLFSDYYLNELLPETSFWEEVKKDKLQEKFNKIKAIYQMQKSSIPNLNESQFTGEINVDTHIVNTKLRNLDRLREKRYNLFVFLGLALMAIGYIFPNTIPDKLAESISSKLNYLGLFLFLSGWIMLLFVKEPKGGNKDE